MYILTACKPAAEFVSYIHLGAQHDSSIGTPATTKDRQACVLNIRREYVDVRIFIDVCIHIHVCCIFGYDNYIDHA